MTEADKHFSVRPVKPDSNIALLDTALRKQTLSSIATRFDKGSERIQHDTNGGYLINLRVDGPLTRRITNRVIEENGFQLVEEITNPQH